MMNSIKNAAKKIPALFCAAACALSAGSAFAQTSATEGQKHQHGAMAPHEGASATAQGQNRSVEARASSMKQDSATRANDTRMEQDRAEATRRSATDMNSTARPTTGLDSDRMDRMDRMESMERLEGKQPANAANQERAVHTDRTK
jgi:hypothetical protein